MKRGKGGREGGNKTTTGWRNVSANVEGEQSDRFQQADAAVWGEGVSRTRKRRGERAIFQVLPETDDGDPVKSEAYQTHLLQRTSTTD